MKNKLYLSVLTISLIVFFGSFVIASGKKVEKLPEKKEADYFKIYTPGTEDVVDYAKYGEFKNVGTNKYKYVPSDFKALKEASGEGIYPNLDSVYKSPRYKELMRDKKLEGDKWTYVNTRNTELNYYKWATAQEDPGVRQYYIALALENAGNY